MSIQNSLHLDREGIHNLPVKQEVKDFLFQLFDNLEEAHDEVFEHAEAGPLKTKDWEIKEAVAGDVTDGNANSVGDLMFTHRTTGSEWLVESTS